MRGGAFLNGKEGRVGFRKKPFLMVKKDGLIWGTCIILCLGIDVSKSKQEELDIYDTMQLCPE